MKKYKSLFPALLVLHFIASGFLNEVKGQVEGEIEGRIEGRWSGTINLHTSFKSNLVLKGTWSDLRVDVSITYNKGTGTVKYEGEAMADGYSLGKVSCSGAGGVELYSLVINRLDSIYHFSLVSPMCKTADDPSYGTFDIVVTDYPLGQNPNHLSGKETTVAQMPNGEGTTTTTITWNLVRSTDVELIVTPQNYDNWLPEPGKDEMRKGSVMNISLKLQGKNGKPLTVKAKSFELLLSNTSTEPGITINFPIAPGNPGLPDLRFLEVPALESIEEDQFIEIPCADGVTGKTYIGSYDGGGWTTLTAVAILEDDTHITGSLLVSGGEQEIRIPKRDIGSKIATAWLTANGNPGEMDDKDTSTRNANDGDGLTAYEEYRGVISKGRFTRLDPNKKELGVKLKRSEFSLLSPGLKWFETATFIKVIPFWETEIPRDRRINKNANSAHIYKQYVLRLENRNMPSGIIGTAYRSPAIPANTDPVVVDWSQIQIAYQFYVRNASPARLLYTQAEMLAWAVAHELAHGVNASHHGDDLQEPHQIAQSIDPTRIFYANGNPVTTRPYTLKAIGRKGSVESGNISCIMAYSPYYLWGYTVGADGAKIFNEVPLLPIANIMCKSKDGTNINATQLYFGDATKGECLNQLKLK